MKKPCTKYHWTQCIGIIVLISTFFAFAASEAQSPGKKPNILMIMGDDIGWFNPRKEFLYWNDDGELVAIRVNQWKVAFKEQEHTGLDVWKRDFTNLRAPNIYNLRSDPFERGPESFDYGKWMVDRAYLLVPAQAAAQQWLTSFKEFPIRQKPASFNLDEVMEQLTPTGRAE